MTALAEPTTGSQFLTDLRREFTRLFQPPRAEVMSIATDAVAVTAAWTLLPASVHDWLFSLSGPMAFAVVLQAWMLGDTATTNVLGNDVEAALTVLPHSELTRRLVRAKSAAIAVLVGIPCAVVGAVLAIVEQQYVAGALLCAVLLAAPFGAAAVSEWLGVFWPYHPRSLSWRWEHRRARRRTFRWLILIVAPFVLVPAIMAALLAIGIAVGASVGGRDASGHLDTAGLAVAATLTVACSIAAFLVAPRFSTVLARRRRTQLTEILLDPDHG